MVEFVGECRKLRLWKDFWKVEWKTCFWVGGGARRRMNQGRYGYRRDGWTSNGWLDGWLWDGCITDNWMGGWIPDGRVVDVRCIDGYGIIEYDVDGSSIKRWTNGFFTMNYTLNCASKSAYTYDLLTHDVSINTPLRQEINSQVDPLLCALRTRFSTFTWF